MRTLFLFVFASTLSLLQAQVAGFSDLYRFPGLGPGEIRVDGNTVYVSGQIPVTGFSPFRFDTLGVPVSDYDRYFLARFDTNRVFHWVKYFGLKQGFERRHKIALGENGEVYFAAHFCGQAYLDDTTYNKPAPSRCDADFFISKYDSAGNLLFSYSNGNLGHNRVHAMCTDSDGNLLVSGSMLGNNSVLAGQIVSPTNGGTFLAKISPVGQLLWFQLLGRNSCERCYMGLDTDEQNNVTVAGTFDSPFSIGSVQVSNPEPNKKFVLKFDPNGQLLWSKTLGGSDVLEVRALSANSTQIAFVGEIEGTLAYGSSVQSSPGNTNGFVISVDAQDGSLNWMRNLGGSDSELFYTVAVDSHQNIFVGGQSEGEFPACNPPCPLPHIGCIIFASFSSNGDHLYTLNNGGPNMSNAFGGRGTSIYISKSQRVYATGAAYGTGEVAGVQFTWGDYYDLWWAELIVDSLAVPRHPRELRPQEKINLFPNPASSKVTLTSTTGFPFRSASVYDASGTQLIELHLKGPGPYQIPVQGCSPGTYFLEVKGKEFNHTMKFLVR